MNEFDDFNETSNDESSEPLNGERTGPDVSEYGEPDMPEGTPGTEPALPPENKRPDGKRLYIPIITLLVLIFLAVSALTIYFICTDISMGSIEFNKKYAEENNDRFSLNINSKPDGGGSTSNPHKNDDGRYDTEELAKYIRPQIVEVYAYNSKSTSGMVSCGSGIIISEDGYIITNTHIIENTLSAVSDNKADNPDSFVVITSDEKKYDAEVIGRDKKTDIAVIKIDAAGLSFAEMGDSDEVEVGESVVAVGNPEGFYGSVTKGIVSGVNRRIKAESTSYVMNCIQTDAAVSSGNSGGALVNMYGQVIGIISSKYVTSTSEGLGFAISINEARPIIEDIMSQGYVSGRVRIGIAFYSTDSPVAAEEFKEKYKVGFPEKLSGIWITDINKDCDIANTELKPGDFILKVNGKNTLDYSELCSAIEGKKAGDTIKAECARIDKDMNITYFDIEFKLMEDTSGDF